MQYLEGQFCLYQMSRLILSAPRLRKVIGASAVEVDKDVSYDRAQSILSRYEQKIVT